MVNMCIFLKLFQMINLLGYFLTFPIDYLLDFFHTSLETLSEMVDLYHLCLRLFYMVTNLVRAPTNFKRVYFILILIFSKKGRTFYNVQIMYSICELFDLLVYKSTKEILMELLKGLLIVALVVTHIIICHCLF